MRAKRKHPYEEFYSHGCLVIESRVERKKKQTKTTNRILENEKSAKRWNQRSLRARVGRNVKTKPP